MKQLILLVALALTFLNGYAQKPHDKKVTNTPQVQHLKLYPTEADKYVNVYLEFSQPADAVITLVGSEKNNEKSWEVKAVTSHQQSIDITALPPGDYTILLFAGNVKEKAVFSIKR